MKKPKMASGGMCECQGEGCAKCMDDGGAVSAQDSMRKAFHYAEGGSVKSKEKLKDDLRGVHTTDYKGLTNQGKKQAHREMAEEIHQMPRPHIPGDKPSPYAHGGEVENPDHEVHEMVGPEMMDAIHSKDHKKLMGCIEAMVLHHMSKKED